MEALTTSVGSDSILPFHLPPPTPNKGRLWKLTLCIGNQPPTELLCEHCCCSPADAATATAIITPPPTRQRCPSRIGSQADLPGCLCLFLSSLVRTAWLWVTHHSILQVAVVQTTPTYASTPVFPLSPVHNAPTTHKPLLCRQPKPAHALLTTADLSPPSNNAIMP